jgi:hypothetical protein
MYKRDTFYNRYGLPVVMRCIFDASKNAKQSRNRPGVPRVFQEV